jgi:hypothetical protein
MLRTGGSPLKLAPGRGYHLPAGKHEGILTKYRKKSRKKTKKKEFATPARRDV